MKHSLTFAAAFLFLFASLCSGQTPKMGVAISQNQGISKFVGMWEGIISFKAPWWTTNRIIVEIKPLKNREVSVRMESLRTDNFRFSGAGIATPNSLSWVELEAEGSQPRFRRFMANAATNGLLAGKYYRERDLQEEGVFSLKKINLEELKAFRNRNTKALERLQAACRNLEFLDVATSRVLPSALAWLNETLGYNFQVIDEDILPDLQYANDLATALETRQNFFAKNPGCEIPLRFTEINHSSSPIKIALVSFPKGFPHVENKYSVVIALHGTRSTEDRIHFNARSAPREIPVIYVKPITEDSWVPTPLNAMFQELRNLLPIDDDRIYLRGISMGAFGAYSWAMHNPELFAAISPISGGGHNFRARRLKNVPVWMFHGEQDESVPFWMAETMLTDLRAAGVNVKHTFYPEGKHALHIGFKAIDEWFLTHKRSKEPVAPDPIEGFKFDERGIGRREIITLPAQRLASIRTSQAEFSQAVRHLYNIFKNAGLPASGRVQYQILPALANGTIILLLPIPKEAEIKNLSNNIQIIDAAPARALSFGIYFDEENDVGEDRLIETVLAEVKSRGEIPNGEIRKTPLTTYYGVSIGNKSKSISQIEIMLRQ